MKRPKELKVARVELVVSDIPKWDDSRVSVDIWDGSTWGNKWVQLDETLCLLRIVMLRWWKCRLTQGFFKSLRRSSSIWRGLEKARQVNVIGNRYEWNEDTHLQHLEYRGRLLEDKDSPQGGTFLERETGSTWWESGRGSFEKKFGMVRSNSKWVHDPNFSNHRRLQGTLM